MNKNLSFTNLIERNNFIADLDNWCRNTIVPQMDYMSCRLQPTLRNIVDDIAHLYGVDPNLALLATMGGFAASDLGRHRVISPTGQSNNLSFFAIAGGASGVGKSAALEPFVNAFDQFAGEKAKEWEDAHTAFEVEQDLAKANYDALIRASKEGLSEAEKRFLLEAKKLMKKKVSPVILMGNDVTLASLPQTLSDQGYFLRLESEAREEELKILSLLAKAWSEESHVQSRVSTASRRFVNTFVVNVLFTQPDFFREIVNNPKSAEMGFIARSFLFNSCSLGKNSKRPFAYNGKEEIQTFKLKIEDVIKSNLVKSMDLYGKRNGNIVDLSLDGYAKECWNDYSDDIQKDLQNARYKYRGVVDFLNRAAQHALKVAGIFHIIENNDIENTTINRSVMESACTFVDAGLEQARVSRVADTNDEQIRCVSAVAEWLLKCNSERFIATQLKNAVRGSYNANTCNVALYLLEQYGAIEKCICVDPLSYGARRPQGRPRGDEYINNLFNNRYQY